MLVNLVWAPKLANMPRCYVFVRPMEIVYLAIRWQSWQTWLKTEKSANIPPQPWGGVGVVWVRVGAKMFSGGRGGITHFIFYLYYSFSLQFSVLKNYLGGRII